MLLLVVRGISGGEIEIARSRGSFDSVYHPMFMAAEMSLDKVCFVRVEVIDRAFGPVVLDSGGTRFRDVVLLSMDQFR